MSRGERIIRIPGETLHIEVTEEEINYRENQFPDFNSAVLYTREQLICSVCNEDIFCYIFTGREIFVHTLLGVLLCRDCYSFYGGVFFSMDEDGDDKNCRWCGLGVSLYRCAKCSCAFCKKCIKRNLDRSFLDEVRENLNWQCFVCKPEPLFWLRSLCWAACRYYEHIKLVQKKREESENNKSGNTSHDDQKERCRDNDSDDWMIKF